MKETFLEYKLSPKLLPNCRLCSGDSLDRKLVKGKIVLCDSRVKGSGPVNAGAVGFLSQGQTFRDTAFSFPLPGSYLELKDGANVYDYIKSTRYQLQTIGFRI